MDWGDGDGPDPKQLRRHLEAMEEALRLAVDLIPAAMRHTESGAKLTAALERTRSEVRF